MAGEVVLSLRTQMGIALDDSNKTLKLVVFRLAKQLEDAAFADEFISAGGTEILLELLQKCSANLLNYAMKALLNLLCKLQGIEHISNNQSAVLRMFNLVYDESPHAVNLIGPASALLHVLAEYSPDSVGFDIFDAAARQAAENRHEKPYQRIIQHLESKSLAIQSNCAKLLNVMLKKSLAVGKMEKFLSYLHQLEISKTLEQVESKVSSSEENKQELEKLRLICDPGGSTDHDLKKRLTESEWRIATLESAVERSSGGDLTSRVAALEGTAAVNQISLQELVALRALNDHIKKMEAKIGEQEEKKDNQLAKIIEQQAAIQAQMEEQKKALESKIKSLESDLQAKDAQNSEALEKLKALSQSQETILFEVSKTRGVASQQEHLKETRNLWVFYQTLQYKLNQVLLAYKMLSSGLVKAEENEKHYLEKGILLAGDLIPFPGARTCATVLSLTVGFVRKKREQKMHEKRAELTVSVNALESLTEQCARALAFMYEEQIVSLDKESVQKMAECCVKRMLASMTTGGLTFDPDISEEELCHLLILAVVQPSFGLLKITEMRFQVQEHLREKDLIWTERGVLSKTGVRTVDGKYYSGGECRPEKYGYRLGDDKLAKDLKLSPTPSRVKSRVLAGSQKTLHVLTINAHVSPLRYASGSKVSTTTTTSTSVVPMASSTSATTTLRPSSGTTVVPSASSQQLVVASGSADVYQEVEALKKRVAYLETTLQQVLGVVIKLQSQIEKTKS